MQTDVNAVNFKYVYKYFDIFVLGFFWTNSASIFIAKLAMHEIQPIQGISNYVANFGINTVMGRAWDMKKTWYMTDKLVQQIKGYRTSVYYIGFI